MQRGNITKADYGVVVYDPFAQRRGYDNLDSLDFRSTTSYEMRNRDSSKDGGRSVSNREEPKNEYGRVSLRTLESLALRRDPRSEQGVFIQLLRFIFGKDSPEIQERLIASFSLMCGSRDRKDLISLRKWVIMSIRSIGLLAQRYYSFLFPLAEIGDRPAVVDIAKSSLASYPFQDVETGVYIAPTRGIIAVPGFRTADGEDFESVLLSIELLFDQQNDQPPYRASFLLNLSPHVVLDQISPTRRLSTSKLRKILDLLAFLFKCSINPWNHG